MGEPNNPCFKPVSPYKLWTTSTTTSTTPVAEQDFFILPVSGVNCPVIFFDSEDNTWKLPDNVPDEQNTFVCLSELYDPNPCIIEVDKYLRVADINIDTNRCRRYKLVIAPPTTTTTTIAPPNPSTTTTTIAPNSICNCGEETGTSIGWLNETSTPLYHNHSTPLQEYRSDDCVMRLSLFSSGSPTYSYYRYNYTWDTLLNYSEDCSSISSENTDGVVGQFMWEIVKTGFIYPHQGDNNLTFSVSLTASVTVWENNVPTLYTVSATWSDSDIEIITDLNNCPTAIILNSTPSDSYAYETFIPIMNTYNPKIVNSAAYATFPYDSIPGLRQDGKIEIKILCE